VNPHLLPRLLAELRSGSERVRLGNLSSVRDYVYVEDVARAIVAAVESELPGSSTVNVGGGSGHSVAEVVQALGELLGRELKTISIARRRRAVDRPFLVADIGQARALLGWEPMASFEEGLARTLHAELLPA
jgi:UDP-glucose 4-epimerase